ncbi:IclR family pca regulon transcriptional regulator [Rhodoligotrophos appendicifer]|uniref:IclR family transcriptional regulator domain-containing protein n=1 Tax=Rhodoligotrophos appendicifer TaxID=987056 RepID=UPI0011849310|nr:IclR family transcriptional regulator C-terminal domain-containing protein [Rhodoligotrophos appendicifer]
MSRENPREERVNSLKRGLAVLKSFARHYEPMTITEVAAETDMAPASARRMLLTLVDLGYVEQNGKRFRVAPKVLDLGYSYLSSMPLWEIAQPVLDRLSELFQISSSASVLDGCDILYAFRATHNERSSVLVSTGTRQPAHVTAMGRVLLASLPPDKLDEVIAQIDFNPLTVNSVSDPAELRMILDKVREQDFSIVDEELEIGLRAIAVPIRNRRGTVVAAINAAGRSQSLTRETLANDILPVMRESADEIRARLPA